MFLDHGPRNRSARGKIADTTSFALDGLHITHLKAAYLSDLAAFHEQAYRFGRFRATFHQFLLDVSLFARSASEEATAQYATQYAKDVFTSEIGRLRPDSGAKMVKTTLIRIATSLGGAAAAGLSSGFANAWAIVAAAIGGASLDLLSNAGQAQQAKPRNTSAIQHYTLLAKANYDEVATRLHRH